MKKFLLKPGFEFIFALSLTVILGLPPVLMAQNQKDVEIKITNGDTTVNGKNIKDLSPKDRQNALRDIKHLNADSSRKIHFFMKIDSGGRRFNRMEIRRRMQDNGGHQPEITENIIIKDSLGNTIETKTGRPRPFSTRIDMNERNFGERLSPPLRPFERKNSQSFDYVTTDNDGISTHLSFRVTEISNEDLKKMPHVEGGKFEISDLNLVPEYSTGKTLVMFNLPAKTIADIKLIDSHGKVLWNDKTNTGSFSKSCVIGLNGIYYLQIKQGNNIAIKKIIKEE
ncbi:MAG: T9SS type A sorting domain-containing protein [Sphingobacteriales bacterium]